ncbi:MAG: rod shape-determining protein MreC [Solirubrobacterales bacterium]|nr:rod shape-determining protein MreC [Solirubrobacterales bacterium]
MYRKQVRRRRAVLLLLVAACFVLLSVYYREGTAGPLHRTQRGVATVFSPIQGGADRALKPARDLINWFGETFDARGENSSLKKELADSREALAAAQTQVQQGNEVKKLLGLSSSGLVPAGREQLTARVIARSPTVWYSTVQINVGSGSGVRVDDPVVTGDGLVGRISTLAPGTAQVILITDHTSSVAARVEPVGATGVIEPEVGNPRDLVLDFVEHGKTINETQPVVTAGFSTDGLTSLYPPGIPIGEVSESSLAEQEAYQRVHVEPYADLRDMEFVQVLIETANK